MSQIHELTKATKEQALASDIVVDNGSKTMRFPVPELLGSVEVSDLSKDLAGYNGQNLTQVYTPAQFKAKVQSGDFSGLHLGDYFDITLTGGEIMRYVISGFNTYLNFGDTAYTKPHVIMTPVDCMAATHNMNSSNTNTGGYAASAMQSYLSNDVLAKFPSAWQSAMAEMPRLENNKGTWAWAKRKLFLLSETEVHGHPVWATDGYDGGTRPIPLFQFSARYRIKGLGFGSSAQGSRDYWWLASPSFANTTNFTYVGNSGFSNGNYASNAYGVAPGFCI